MDEETRAYIGFSVFPGIGPVRFKLLFDYFGSAVDAWNATPATLKKIRLGETLTEKFLVFRKKFATDIDDYLKELERLHVSVLTIRDKKYPKLLSQIPDAPFLLYIRGKRTERAIDMEKTIGVVGTRKITPYGVEVTRKIAGRLAARGVTIVSGLAYGVDAVAHQAALDVGGKTIAVLGCGIDIIAPPSNARLYESIANGGGAIVSEMPLGHRPLKGLFPARNRIISGLSLGVVVTEGADDSGSLITARNAGEQGREVFAVPGPITSALSHGPAKLLKNGAKLVETVDDILDELGLEENKQIRKYTNKQMRGETKEEDTLLKILAKGRSDIDTLIRASGLTSSAVSSTLCVLELKGFVRDYGEKEYGLT